MSTQTYEQLEVGLAGEFGFTVTQWRNLHFVGLSKAQQPAPAPAPSSTDFETQYRAAKNANERRALVRANRAAVRERLGLAAKSSPTAKTNEARTATAQTRTTRRSYK